MRCEIQSGYALQSNRQFDSRVTECVPQVRHHACEAVNKVTGDAEKEEDGVSGPVAPLVDLNFML